MPRTSSTALAVSVALGLTLGTAATFSVQARQATPSAPAAAASTASGAARSGCARKYKNPKTKLGVNLSTVARDGRGGASASRATFNPPRVVRTWVNGDDPQSAWKGQTRGLPRKSAMVISIRHSPQEVISGQWDSQINGFFKHAPKHRLIFWNYYHEPENGVKAHEFTTAQYRAAFRHVGDIAAKYCRSKLIPTLVLMGWTADPRSGPGSHGAWKSWRSFYPGKHYVSVVAWDPYNSATVKPRSYKSPHDLYHYAVRDARSVGKRWGIAETGSARISGDQGQGRARWLHKVAKYSRKHNAAFVTYFNSTGRVNDFRLTDSASWRAWRAEMRS